MSDNLPFENLKVVELASVLAGPAVGMFFAELGATVIKIENKTTGGDITRSWRTSTEVNSKDHSAYYHSINWNKKSLFLDLKNKDDYNLTIDYLKEADIVITNYKYGAAAQLKMDYPTLKMINPQLIYGSITAYGVNDKRVGFDALIQAESGWMSINGYPDGPPTKLPVALIDILAAHQLKQGILVALLEREKNNIGSHVTVSLYDTALASLVNQSSNYLNNHNVPQRKGSLHPNIAPYGETFSTLDNKTLLLAVGSQKQFVNLCKILNEPDMATNEKYKTNQLRLENRSDLYDSLKIAIQKLNSTYIQKQANILEVPLGLVKNIAEAIASDEAQKLILTQKENDNHISKRLKTTIFKFDEEDNT